MTRGPSAPALCALQMEHSCDDPSAAFALCRERSVLGLGWGVEATHAPGEETEAGSRRPEQGIHPAVRAFIDLPEGALVWTRDPDDQTFYLAEIRGPWLYLDDPAATAADLHNVRPVRMVACPIPTQVPIPVTNAFIGTWTLQLIHNSMTTLRSAAVFAGLSLDDTRAGDAAAGADRPGARSASLIADAHMERRVEKSGKRTKRASGGAWYWCAPCAQRWQLEVIPQLQAEGCPLCGGELVPILGRHQHRDDRSGRDQR